MTAQAKDKVFALVPKAMNNPFFDQARDGCMKAAKEIGGVQCLFIGPADATEQEQVQVVQDLITKHVDGIGVSAANAPAIAKVLGRAKEANIPVVTWDSDLLPADKGLRASYIGTVNEQVGIAVAKQAIALEAERRHVLHPDRRPGRGQYERPHQGHDGHPASRQVEAGRRVVRSTTTTTSRCRSRSSPTCSPNTRRSTPFSMRAAHPRWR